MADNAPLTKQDLLDALTIERQHTKQDLLDALAAERQHTKNMLDEYGANQRLQFNQDLNNAIGELREDMATKQDVASLRTELKTVHKDLEELKGNTTQIINILVADQTQLENDKVSRSEFDELHRKAHAN